VSSVGLLWFAKWNGVNSIGGLAQKAGKKWPPPPPISAWSLLTVLGLPLAPEQLALQGPAPGTLDYGLTWEDSGHGSPLQATSWQWKVLDASGALIAGGTVKTLGVPPVEKRFKYGGDYTWYVAGSNNYGTGPSASFSFEATPPPGGGGAGSPPTITANIASDDKVTVSGKYFNKSQPVHIQATVQGSITTPNLAPNNTQDSRNQYTQTTSDPNGSFSVIILPQGFKQAQFVGGKVAYVLAGETIAVVAANDNVGSYSPGPGVSNNVTTTAPATV